MKNVSVLLATTDYRGDHSKDVMVAINLIEGETVEQLVKRILSERGATDHIELRISVDAPVN